METKFLELKPHKPIVQGRARHIYEYPGRPDLLVKVHRSHKAAEGAGWFEKWFRNQEDLFVYMTTFTREISVYVRSRYETPDPMVEHIAPISGLIDTDKGLGLVVSAVRGTDGELAPTLGKLIKSGEMNASRIEKARDLAGKIAASQLTLGDLNFSNIVLEQKEDGSEKFYLIDGLGEVTFIPIQAISKFARNKRKREFAAKIERKISNLDKAGN